METLTNPEIIAISQDPLGQAACTVGVGDQDGGDLQVYAKAMEDGSFAVALLNRGSKTADMSISPKRDLTVAWEKYTVRDVWKHETTGPYDTPYSKYPLSLSRFLDFAVLCFLGWVSSSLAPSPRQNAILTSCSGRGDKSRGEDIASNRGGSQCYDASSVRVWFGSTVLIFQAVIDIGSI
jgi:hypothetical protein